MPLPDRSLSRSPTHGQTKEHSGLVFGGVQLWTRPMPEDSMKRWSEQGGMCRACGLAMGQPPAGEPGKGDPVELERLGIGEGGGSSMGYLDRSMVWYCPICALGHPAGVASTEYKAEALRRGWAMLAVWKGEPGPWEKVAGVILGSVQRGDISVLPALALAGWSFVDLWALPNFLVSRIQRSLTGFPSMRPGSLRDRVYWSGPGAAPLVSFGVWEDIRSQAVLIPIPDGTTSSVSGVASEIETSVNLPSFGQETLEAPEVLDMDGPEVESSLPSRHPWAEEPDDK